MIRHSTYFSKLITAGLLLLPLLLFATTRYMGFDGLYGMDSFEYFRYSKEVNNYILGGGHPGAFFWTAGYPLVTAILGLLLPISLAGQVVSLLSLYGIFYFSWRIVKLIYTSETGIAYLLISLLLAPYLLRNGVQFMSDLLAVFCLVATTFYGFLFIKNQTYTALIWCSFFAAFACFVRLGTGISIIPLFIAVAIMGVKHFKPTYLMALIPLIAVYSLHYLFAVDTNLGTHHFIDEWSFSNFFESSFSSNATHNLASHSNPFPNIIYYFGLYFYPGFFFLNGIFLLYWIKIKKTFRVYECVLIASTLITSLFLAGVTYQGDRYLFPAYPMLVILLLPAFNQLFAKLKSFKSVVIIFLIIVQLGLSARAIYPTFERNRLEKEIVEELSSYQNATLYIFEMDLALQQRGLNFEYKNLWEKEYQNFETGYVLFNLSKFELSFAGKPPMNNWEKLSNNYELKKLKTFKNGWKLYEIQ